MSGLACFLKSIGHDVIGSDTINDYGFETKLKEQGIKIIPFSAALFIAANKLLVSSFLELELLSPLAPPKSSSSSRNKILG